MAPPKTWDEACEAIKTQFKPSLRQGMDAYQEAMKANFHIHQRQYSFMQGKTVYDVFHHLDVRNSQKRAAIRNAPLKTPQQLWDEVAKLDVVADPAGICADEV